MIDVGDKLLDYKQAQQEIFSKIIQAGSESVRLPDALGRVLAADLIAEWDLPRHDNSAMDGFAIQAGDGAKGSDLEIIGTLAAGSTGDFVVNAGTAVRIMTGAVIPPGADAVIPVEKVNQSGTRVRLLRQVESGDHIRRRGEDLRQGDLALAAGIRLSSLELGLLATFGKGMVDVYRRPKVAVLATGSELVAPGETLASAQIYDSNTTALCAAVAEAGCEPVPIGIAEDDRTSLADLVVKGLKCDVLITAAGASVGEFDLVRQVLQESGCHELFWGVSIKPGKPTAFSLYRNKPIFCLPGNPVSALVTFELFVRPALLKMTGREKFMPETITLPLAESIKKKPVRTLFARVRLLNRPDGLYVSSAGRQQTGIMTTLTQADALAILPDGESCFEAGAKVEVLLLRQR